MPRLRFVALLALIVAAVAFGGRLVAAQDTPRPMPTGMIHYFDPALSAFAASSTGGAVAIDDIVLLEVAVDMSGMSRDIKVVAGKQPSVQAAIDAVRGWQWTPPKSPFTAMVGMNLARDPRYDNIEPVRVGNDIKAPPKLKDVRPVYPAEAQASGIQGIVIAEMLIDGGGTVVAANVVRSIPGLDAAALFAMLQWKFAPDPINARKLMTVTCNFTLSSGVTGGIVGGVPGVPPPPPPPPPGVSGGVAGGVSEGVQGGVIGGMASGGVVGGIVDGRETSFGLPRAIWPSNAIVVGGNIKPPLKTADVRPIYPEIALKARVQGMVMFEVLVGEDGSVAAGRILRSIPLLDQAAIQAVQQWRFTPTLLNGTPVPVLMTVTVNFTLQ